ncbi:MAG: sigma-70 family RNA polymerase sigma factor [Phycisphaerales bacterium]|nr:MAG: sigma-70 family RNA polymerase sigma factor [Phycisphaerales bacterium]
MLEDERLVWRLKRGDKEALRRIYEKYKNRLLTLAVSLVHDPGAAEDVLHDVFVSFAGGVGQLQLRGSLHKYLTASVVNRVRDRYRRNKHRSVELECVAEPASNSSVPEQSAMLNEESHRLTAALGELPLLQREVIVLRLNAGMKFTDIAEMQGVSLSTAQGRYRYGLDKLRMVLRGGPKR